MEFYNITYPAFLQNKFAHHVWKKTFCPNGFHLFDEVGSDRHYLYCDACEFEVELKK